MRNFEGPPQIKEVIKTPEPEIVPVPEPVAPEIPNPENPDGFQSVEAEEAKPEEAAVENKEEQPENFIKEFSKEVSFEERNKVAQEIKTKRTEYFSVKKETPPEVLEKSLGVDKSGNNNIERSANFDSNESLLFLERLDNPIVRDRLINDLWEHEKTKFKTKNKKITREEIAEKLQKDIDYIFSRTEVDFLGQENSGYEGTPGIIALGGRRKDGDNIIKQRSIFEAHEKGHGLRPYDLDSSLVKRIRAVFDLSSIARKISPKSRQMLKELSQNYSISDKEINHEIASYFKNTAELVERMAQLKNYFGMSGSELFTIEHLNYARKHYVEDTNCDNLMSVFFNLIPNHKEESFIGLMNSLGI